MDKEGEGLLVALKVLMMDIQMGARLVDATVGRLVALWAALWVRV